jgi:hypothetical protein
MFDIVCYWSKPGECFSVGTWVVSCLDEEGNQLWDSQYYPNREQLRADWSI